jgi:hypothetical protein
VAAFESGIPDYCYYLMNRTVLINHLIGQRKARRYLEISSHDAEDNFAHIHCSHKAILFPDSSTDFIANEEKFDIIFIDGIHTETQVLKDISVAFLKLAANGIILLHDCMPPDAWHQREPEAYKKGENWNGTAWKAVLRTFNESCYKCTLLDTDWGCGLIDTMETQVPKRLHLPETLAYEHHYTLLLEYKISVAAYLREQTNVFYHLACMGNWRDVFGEQMQQFQQNGFRRIDLTLLGNGEDVKTAAKIYEGLKLEVRIIFQAPELSHFEKPALLAIEAYAKNNAGYVLYTHSKGVSNPADGTKAKWRRLMMRELVDGWERCVVQLPYYDVIGVNWRDMPPTSHFCGNFWYASTGYLRNLADFSHYYDHPRYQIWDSISNKRLGCEFWISSGKQGPRVLSVFCRNVDFCNAAYWRNR